jgi:hypothetical protein
MGLLSDFGKEYLKMVGLNGCILGVGFFTIIGALFVGVGEPTGFLVGTFVNTFAPEGDTVVDTRDGEEIGVLVDNDVRLIEGDLDGAYEEFIGVNGGEDEYTPKTDGFSLDDVALDVGDTSPLWLL